MQSGFIDLATFDEIERYQYGDRKNTTITVINEKALLPLLCNGNNKRYELRSLVNVLPTTTGQKYKTFENIVTERSTKRRRINDE